MLSLLHRPTTQYLKTYFRVFIYPLPYSARDRLNTIPAVTVGNTSGKSSLPCNTIRCIPFLLSYVFEIQSDTKLALGSIVICCCLDERGLLSDRISDFHFRPASSPTGTPTRGRGLSLEAKRSACKANQSPLSRAG
jgi:hypothetical protein